MKDRPSPEELSSFLEGAPTGSCFGALPGSGRRFSLAGQIGVGGVGSVYKAWDEVLGKFVALKMIEFSDSVVEARLRREAALAQSLTHPSIVRIHDLVEFQGRLCLSMEYVAGPDLADLLGQGPLDIDTVSRFAEQICAGLQAAHRAGIVHCDLKPSNLLLDGDRIRIADFGLALQTDAPNGPPVGDGTPAYMSPEQQQSLPIDRRTDFYSFGLVLFELLCGRRATKAELDQVSAETLRRPLPGVPRRLRRILAQCLQCRPNDRYADAGEILSDLQRSRLLRPSRKRRVFPAFLRRRRERSVVSAPEFSFHLTWSVPVLCCCFLAALPWSRWLSASGSRQRGSPAVMAVALLPLQSGSVSVEPLADGLDDYLRAVSNQFSGWQVWTPAPRSRPSRRALTQAALTMTGQVGQVGEYFTVHLAVEQGATRTPLFSFTVSAKSAFELEDRLWDRLQAEPHLSRWTAGAVKPPDYCQRRTESGAWYLRANSLIRRQRSEQAWREAVDLLNRALAEDPRCTLCYARKAAAELKLCDALQDPRWLQDVLTDVQQAQEINENSEPAVLAAAQVYARTGRRKEAVLLLRRAEQADAKSAEFPRALGGILADEGLYTEALSELRLARQRNPLDIRSLNTTGATELLIPDYPAAVRAFTELLALDPEIPYAHANLASAYLRAGRFAEAVTALETVIEKQPGAAGYSNFGMALFFTGKPQMGLTLFEKAAALEPNSEVYAGNLAHAYRWRQADAQARSAYQKAIELARREAQTVPSGRVWADLGLYSAALGDADSFHRYFQQARAESPSDLDTLYKEAVAASLLGLPDRSLELLRKVCGRGYPMATADGNPDLALIRPLPEFSALKRFAAPTD